MSAPDIDTGLFGPEGWHRPTYSHISVEYPRWWDDDPTDTSSGEEVWIARRLRDRDEHAVAAQRREIAAWCEQHTQERSA